MEFYSGKGLRIGAVRPAELADPTGVDEGIPFRVCRPESMGLFAAKFVPTGGDCGSAMIAPAPVRKARRLRRRLKGLTPRIRRRVSKALERRSRAVKKIRVVGPFHVGDLDGKPVAEFAVAFTYAPKPRPLVGLDKLWHELETRGVMVTDNRKGVRHHLAVR